MSKKINKAADCYKHAPLCGNTLRVGGIGHRPSRLKHASSDRLLEQIKSVLSSTRTIVNELLTASGDCLNGETMLRVITSLAEGSDQFIATAALALGVKLECPLPFPREIFESTFSDQGSIPAFRKLIIQADVVFEMGGDLGKPEDAYHDTARALLAQSDILLAISDGQPAAGIGGTSETIDFAYQRGIGIFIIEAAAPHRIRFNDSSDWINTLREYLKGILLLPSEAAQAWWNQYFSEPWPSRIPQTYHLFTSAMSGGQFRFKRLPTPEDKICEISMPALRDHFSWSDNLAVSYAHRSRSAALRMQLWMSMSVVFAFLAIPLEHHSRLLIVCSFSELGSLLLLFVNALRPKDRGIDDGWFIARSLKAFVALTFLPQWQVRFPQLLYSVLFVMRMVASRLLACF